MLRALLPALFLAGCAPSGVFMIFVPYSESATECSTTVSENFSDAYSPADEDEDGGGPWTITEDYTGSDSLMFVHISPTSGGGAVLTMGDAAYPGVAEGDGWTFTWTQHTDGNYSAEHKDDYDYTEAYTNDSTVNIHVTSALFAGLSGTISGTGSSTMSWTESDEWDVEDIEVYTGQIPSQYYLVYKDSGDLIPQTNEAEEDDCKGGTCELAIEQACSTSGQAFTAERVEGNDVLLYNDWIEDGQSGGGGGSVDTGF